MKTWIKRTLAALALGIALAGCASAGLEPAQSFDDKIAYVQSGVTAARQAAKTALLQGRITDTDAKAVLNATDDAAAALKLAREAERINAGTAQSKLALAGAILADVQAYLTQRGVK